MIDADRRRPGFARWLRGVRGRLVATYLLAAVILAAAGVVLFTVTLQRGLRNNVDAGLQTRVDGVASDLGARVSRETVDPAPTVGVGHPRSALQAFTAVYDPSGALVDAQPSTLPSSPLTDDQARRVPTSPTVRTAPYAGESFRILASPLRRPDGTWVVVVGQNLGAVEEANTQVRHALLIAVPVLLVLVGVGAWLLSGAALRPVDRMRADAQSLGEHDPAGRITEPPTRDSLNQLARTFNALLDRLHTSLDRQRTLVADAGHELRTPLAVLQTELETAVRPTRSRADLVDSIEHARVEVARLTELAEDLLLLAEADGGQPIVRRQLTDVSELLDSTVRAYRSRADEHAVALQLDRPNPLIADVDPIALRRILDNLLSNALRHTPAGGRISIRVVVDDAAPDGAVLTLRVTDTGEGFPARFVPHVFERFGRADQGRSRSASAAGTGLGLAIVAALAAAHGGTAAAGNVPGGGAVLDVSLPLQPDEPATADAARRPPVGG